MKVYLLWEKVGEQLNDTAEFAGVQSGYSIWVKNRVLRSIHARESEALAIAAGPSENLLTVEEMEVQP